MPKQSHGCFDGVDQVDIAVDVVDVAAASVLVGAWPPWPFPPRPPVGAGLDHLHAEVGIQFDRCAGPSALVM